jgi:hypothetical protein
MAQDQPNPSPVIPMPRAVSAPVSPTTPATPGLPPVQAAQAGMPRRLNGDAVGGPAIQLPGGGNTIIPAIANTLGPAIAGPVASRALDQVAPSFASGDVAGGLGALATGAVVGGVHGAAVPVAVAYNGLDAIAGSAASAVHRFTDGVGRALGMSGPAAAGVQPAAALAAPAAAAPVAGPQWPAGIHAPGTVPGLPAAVDATQAAGIVARSNAHLYDGERVLGAAPGTVTRQWDVSPRAALPGAAPSQYPPGYLQQLSDHRNAAVAQVPQRPAGMLDGYQSQLPDHGIGIIPGMGMPKVTPSAKTLEIDRMTGQPDGTTATHLALLPPSKGLDATKLLTGIYSQIGANQTRDQIRNANQAQFDAATAPVEGESQAARQKRVDDAMAKLRANLVLDAQGASAAQAQQFLDR